MELSSSGPLHTQTCKRCQKERWPLWTEPSLKDAQDLLAALWGGPSPGQNLTSEQAVSAGWGVGEGLPGCYDEHPQNIRNLTRGGLFLAPMK